MPTMIESLTGVSVNSPFFSNRPVFELFPIHNKPPKKNRVALLYGPNGSGKSTLAQGFREYIDSTTPRTVDVVPMCGSKHWVLSPGARPEKVFVFDEKYVERSVKIQTSGLDAIVLFGEQVQLEQQIQAVMQSIEQHTELMRQQEEDYRKFEDPSNVNSPQYWIASITRILRAKDGWAETDGIKIKKHRTSSGVNLREIDRIGALQPSTSVIVHYNRRSIFDFQTIIIIVVHPDVPLLLLRGGNHLSNCEDSKCHCLSIFKDGSSETTIERYTAAWVRLINLLEKSNNYVTESPNDE